MHVAEIIRWVLAVGCGLLGWWIIILNFTIVYRWWMRRAHSSWIPLLGGFLAFFGMLACPLRKVEAVAWIPLVVDGGFLGVNLTVGFAGLMCRRLGKGKRNDA